MKLKNVIYEDFVNYKKPSMFLVFPYCSFKCDKECGRPICQNSNLAKERTHDISIIDLINDYYENPITESVVLGGLEPFDSWAELQVFVMLTRLWIKDDIVIYTGYIKEEIEDKISWLKQFDNIIIKFGRFIPDEESHFDETLGINLASKNQYAERL